DQFLPDAVRQKALDLAMHYGGDANALSAHIWGSVLRPPPPNSTPIANSRRERQMEAACRADPDNGSRLNTLGILLYRAGEYQKALDTLLHSERLNAEAFGESITFDLAFLAMCHYQLGRREQAQIYLKRTRESIKEFQMETGFRNTTRWFLQEAETLIEGK